MKKTSRTKIVVLAILISSFGLFSGCNGKDTTDAFHNNVQNEDALSSSGGVHFLSNYIEQEQINFEPKKEVVVSRGIYVTANRAGGTNYMNDLLAFCNSTEVNSMVIDVKTDKGEITFKGIPQADEMGISENFIPDVPGLMKTLQDNNIYPIARIVCFKDNGAFEKFPELYIKDENGAIWRDSSSLKSAWLNPYNKDAWDYILYVAKAAAQVGFKEIQFDYIRFDTSPRLKTADFGDTQGKSRKEIILEFTKYAMEQLKPYGVNVSADVYGTVINSDVDAEIVGQDYTEMARVLDYICPMVYPSHYADNTMGIDHPDVHPYDTIYQSMLLSNKRLEAIGVDEHKAIVRPWLQDFTASWLSKYIKYGGKERKEQIQGVYDAGLSEWILWDASVRYDAEGLELATGSSVNVTSGAAF